MAAETITIGLGTTGLAALTAASASGLMALASGAALAGAIGLGIAGIAVVATHGKRHGGRGYGGHGYGGYGGHGGHKIHGGYGYKKGYGYHRKRRSTEHGNGERNAQGVHSSKKGQRHDRRRRSPEQSSEAIRNLLEVIRAEDVTGCGLKLVCELAGLPEETLFEEEYAILNLIGPAVVQPGEGLLPSSGASDYATAKEFGRLRGDCLKAFPMCPLNGTELMGAVMRFLP